MPPESTDLNSTAQILNSLAQVFLYVGSLGGFVSAIYVIFGRSFNRPLFRFDEKSSSGVIEQNPENSHNYYKLAISGQLKNCSESPNSIAEIHYVIWENDKKRNRSLAHGLILDPFRNVTKQSEERLPLYFREKEGFDLAIKTSIVLTGTHVEELVLARKSLGNGFTLPKHDFKLAFVDTSGNFFDEKGRIRSEEEMGLWWTLPNTFNDLKKGNPIPYLKHFAKIVLERIKYTVMRTFRRLGL